ncbi:MAG: cystathionine gamma-synthase [Gammaproteobacteria bacterium]|jgi:cystathionine gamma-synthase|nr:cystathionine gamma-synthase [Gammaproteobacteria bacterium]MDH3758325.1 cystathionine gamma-synthase [Gammaproteobacteria bacterium]MDH3847555.1 cystathionine gamma-synthase [Gammaproteobacteria bacterium]MDH3864906.1 cystathionine gamma-synthase [Gammaproteobacteria bacterium]MDH3905506.1 cystathionine gamma-synthase [Gammaproteobacteria bacterium]
MTSQASKATRAVRTAIESDTQHGAVVPPLHLSSNYAFAGFGEKRHYDYTRSGNPTRDALGEALTTLEEGAGAVVTASGMAALNVMVQLLDPGDLLIVPHDCYGGTYRLYEALGRKGHFEVLFIDQTDDQALADACARRPKLILTETPSNPLLRIVDIAKVAALARECGALYAVDNTFLSPALQQPITLGADIVIHSTTKYINGHSDVVGGALVAATPELAEELTWWANCIGATGAPFDSFLTLRGLRTLQVRMRQHEETASLLARVLDEQGTVRRVNYPGLETHPGHAIARRQQSGFGGMISFELDGGEDAVRAFVDRLRYFSLAESLGGVESLVCHPPSMTHAPVSDEALAAAGIGQGLIRLSVGLEAGEDLVDDVLKALDAAKAALAPEPVAVFA